MEYSALTGEVAHVPTQLEPRPSAMGTAVGSPYNEGGASNYFSLHIEPQTLQVRPGFQSRSRIAGVEYSTLESDLSGRHGYNVPCSVCFTSKRGSQLMIPGRTSCPTSWTREYQVIMSARFNHQCSSFVCVIETLEVIPTPVVLPMEPHFI